MFGFLGRAGDASLTCDQLVQGIATNARLAKTRSKASHRKAHAKRVAELQAEYDRRCVFTTQPITPVQPVQPDTALVPGVQAAAPCPVGFYPTVAGCAPVTAQAAQMIPQGGGQPLFTPISAEEQEAYMQPAYAQPAYVPPASPAGPWIAPIPDAGFEDYQTGFEAAQIAQVEPVSMQTPGMAPIGECDPAVNGLMPLEYSDAYGPMKVLQIVCGAQVGTGGGIEGASGIAPLEQSEIETFSGGMRGLYMGLGRDLH